MKPTWRPIYPHRQVIALIPAHNEAAGIAHTIHALHAQSREPDRIIVIADNCTDDTADIARAAGAEVLETEGNVDKKAGALNQALARILPTLGDDAFVLVQDADTVLSPDFIAATLARFADPEVGAVGGSFYALTETNLVQIMQGNEYARYVREISRRPEARANVLTGAGSIFRARTLREVSEARLAGRLPGRGVYKQDALTEDNELTLAIKRLGYKVVSPKRAAIYTEAPRTWRELLHQRIRWRRGALEDLKAHGLNRITAPYIGKMLWSVLVSLLSIAYIGLLALVIVLGQQLIPSPFWLTVLGIHLLDRWWTVRDRPWRAQLVAATFIWEAAYDVFQQIVLGRSLWDFFRRGDQRWVHTPAAAGH